MICAISKKKKNETCKWQNDCNHHGWCFMLVDPGLQWNYAIEMQQWIILIQYFYEPKQTFICTSLFIHQGIVCTVCVLTNIKKCMSTTTYNPENIGSHSAIQMHLFNLKSQDVEALGQIWLVVFILNGQIISDCNCYGYQYKPMCLSGELLQ